MKADMGIFGLFWIFVVTFDKDKEVLVEAMKRHGSKPFSCWKLWTTEIVDRKTLQWMGRNAKVLVKADAQDYLAELAQMPKNRVLALLDTSEKNLHSVRWIIADLREAESIIADAEKWKGETIVRLLKKAKATYCQMDKCSDFCRMRDTIREMSSLMDQGARYGIDEKMKTPHFDKLVKFGKFRAYRLTPYGCICEGAEMKHCASGYANGVEKGKEELWSIHIGKIRATIRWSYCSKEKGLLFAEMRGKSNGRLSKSFEGTVAKWIDWQWPEDCQEWDLATSYDSDWGDPPKPPKRIVVGLPDVRRNNHDDDLDLEIPF